jgi:uncharacterized membrane protein YedE/YeeE
MSAAEAGETGPGERSELDTDPWVFWPAMAIGAAVVVYGLARWAPWESSVDLGTYFRWTIGLAVFHDLVLGPAAGLAGLALAAVVRPPYRAVVQAGALVAAVTVLYSIPFVRGWGRSSNDSVLPRDYGRGLAIVLTLVTVATIVGLVVAAVRSHRTRPGA